MGPNESRNLWISIGAGVFATFMLYSYSQEKKVELEKAVGDKVRVVVAKEDIREMDSIYDNVVEIVEKNKAEVEPDYYASVPDLVGGVAAIPIKKGQTITKNQILEPGPETGMAIQVSPNKRAVTIPVSDERANARLIRPGDRVDIMAVIDSGKGINQKREVTVLMQDVIILATGVNVHNNLPRTIEKDPTGKNLIQTTLTGDTKYNTLTIESDMQQAQDLIYLISSSPSSLFFLLRNPNDRKTLPRFPASSADTLQNRALVPSSGFSVQPQPNLMNSPGR
ncbi:MAG: Flp pilus assembly protein CpaB [Bdellovibrionales bacterium RIFCSPHIGHO2_01_FULL_40_29]|nr:MAG: Flp pilus assembly protein CpaB [Bdellovibrionales bacterium RIFCSPHIGHO2_01_FULL_40_29]OFZ35020.1 MAG: Flp pilus assembly protein CpaB [Bdellovibrionales bacterium RIFCSPHIGHO2_02_FULL_40_15]